jgi:hypothetical protein
MNCILTIKNAGSAQFAQNQRLSAPHFLRTFASQLILFYQILIDTLAIRNARKLPGIFNFTFSNRHFLHSPHAPSCHTSFERKAKPPSRLSPNPFRGIVK